jgi:serine/threonine protein kinase
LLDNAKEYVPLEKTLKILKGTLEGLVQLQKCGIVHRDIKPDNILLSEGDISLITSKSVKICDFGLAARVDQNNPIFGSCGTPGYVAPELVKQRNIETKITLSQNSDVFACGVIAYLLVTGCMAISGKTNKEILENTMSGYINFSNPKFKTMQPEVQTFFKSLLRLDPETRPSPSEALVTVQSLLTQEEKTEDIKTEIVLEEFNDHLIPKSMEMRHQKKFITRTSLKFIQLRKKNVETRAEKYALRELNEQKRRKDNLSLSKTGAATPKSTAVSSISNLTNPAKLQWNNSSTSGWTGGSRKARGTSSCLHSPGEKVIVLSPHRAGQSTGRVFFSPTRDLKANRQSKAIKIIIEGAVIS